MEKDTQNNVYGYDGYHWDPWDSKKQGLDGKVLKV